ncbi:MAG: hypothetical protein R2939_00180 [Kofleriaceae bacterium]
MLDMRQGRLGVVAALATATACGGGGAGRNVKVFDRQDEISIEATTTMIGKSGIEPTQQAFAAEGCTDIDANSLGTSSWSVHGTCGGHRVTFHFVAKEFGSNLASVLCPTAMTPDGCKAFTLRVLDRAE